MEEYPLYTWIIALLVAGYLLYWCEQLVKRYGKTAQWACVFAAFGCLILAGTGAWWAWSVAISGTNILAAVKVATTLRFFISPVIYFILIGIWYIGTKETPPLASFSSGPRLLTGWLIGCIIYIYF